ncbi:hypothetical protein BR93DRAFT_934189 [Coniochaeta sp. PMI_546]|nr:hypothetical protein BR93DRAFT_934189 [Coniochaeta sp. PMI_546]
MDTVARTTGIAINISLEDGRKWMTDAGFEIAKDECVPFLFDKMLQWMVINKFADIATSYYSTIEEYKAFVWKLERELDFRQIRVEVVRLIGKKVIREAVDASHEEAIIKLVKTTSFVYGLLVYGELEIG